jgi:hypothetical protein
LHATGNSTSNRAITIHGIVVVVVAVVACVMAGSKGAAGGDKLLTAHLHGKRARATVTVPSRRKNHLPQTVFPSYLLIILKRKGIAHAGLDVGSRPNIRVTRHDEFASKSFSPGDAMLTAT